MRDRAWRIPEYRLVMKLADLAEIGIEPDELDRILETADRPVLVDFWAPCCGACKLMAPSVLRLSQEKSSSLKVVTLNVETGQEVALQHNVASLPTVILFKGRQEVKRLIGMKSYNNLVGEFEEILASVRD